MRCARSQRNFMGIKKPVRYITDRFCFDYRRSSSVFDEREKLRRDLRHDIILLARYAGVLRIFWGPAHDLFHEVVHERRPHGRQGHVLWVARVFEERTSRIHVLDLAQ